MSQKPSTAPNRRAKLGISVGLMCLSVGLKDAKDNKDDLTAR